MGSPGDAFSCTLFDVDGLLLLASENALAERWAREPRPVGYTFPLDELPARLDRDVRSRRVVAFWTRVRGAVEVDVSYLERPPQDSGAEPRQLTVGEDDHVVLMPFWQYTLAAAYNRGRPVDIEGLCARFDLGPGPYEVWVHPAVSFSPRPPRWRVQLLKV